MNKKAIVDYFPAEAKKALSHSGIDIISEIGADIIRDVVLGILIGENIRNSTELLTRKRLLTLNAATLIMLMDGRADDPLFIEELHERAYKRLSAGGVPAQEKIILQWVLGLNGKAFQNVLSGDLRNLKKYTENYQEVIDKSVEEFEKDYGGFKGKLSLGNRSIDLDWKLASYLMTITGSQTMSIRGSDKSSFGKLFEKLILGSLLVILGFKQVEPPDLGNGKNVFWLSERQAKRESDATILLEKGKGIRFDIGFIGPGNSEISLDKVSRFEREIELATEKHYMATIVIVDRLGPASRTEELARGIGGHIVQMSGAYWPSKIARILQEYGYNDEILNTQGTNLHALLTKRLKDVNFSKLVKQGFDQT